MTEARAFAVFLPVRDGEDIESLPFAAWDGKPCRIGALLPADVLTLRHSPVYTGKMTLNDCHYSLAWKPVGGKTDLGLTINSDNADIIQLNLDGEEMQLKNAALYRPCS